MGHGVAAPTVAGAADRAGGGDAVARGGRSAQPAVDGAGPLLGAGTWALLLVGGLFAVLAATSAWAAAALATSDGFADTAATVLDDPAVRAGIADQVVTALEEQPMASLPAVVAHPLLEKVVAEVVASEAFRDVFRSGVRQLHAGLLQGRTQLLVEVDDAVPLVKDALRLINPVLADAISDAQIDFVVGLTQSASVDRAMAVMDRSRDTAVVLGAVAVLSFAAAVWWSPHRRRAWQALGGLLLMVGIGAIVLLGVSGAVVRRAGSTPREQDILGAVFDAMANGLRGAATASVLAGAVLVAAATIAGRGWSIPAWRQRGTALGRRLDRWGWRFAAWCLAGLAATTALWRPMGAGAVLLRLSGFVLLVVSLAAVLEAFGARTWPVAADVVMRRRARRAGVLYGAGLAAASVGVVVAGGSVLDTGAATPEARPAMALTGCNGAVELCDRRLDQVVFAGTHNSMAAAGADGRWWFARQTLGIAPQLEDGIRAFLLDLHFGVEANGIVRSDFRTEVQRQQAAADLGPEERAVMERLLAMMGLAPEEADREVYLCHGYCEFGATPAVDAFRRIDTFLEQHPNEVVILVLEDHLPAEAGVGALVDSGLGERAYTWRPGSPLPTLGEMIELERNVLVLVEHEAGAATWYQPAFDELLQETGYRFEDVDEMSCRIGRGAPDNPLFLVNHWVDRERIVPADATEVNAASVIRERLDRCADVRGQLPNIVAVDFYNQGGLFTVVDELNGVDTADARDAD